MTTEVEHKLGTHTLIFSLRLKGWLFMQSWLTKLPDTQKHPLLDEQLKRILLRPRVYQRRRDS